MTPSTPIAPFISLTSLFVTVTAKNLRIQQIFEKFTAKINGNDQKIREKTNKMPKSRLKHSKHYGMGTIWKQKQRAFKVFKHSLNTQGEKTQ